MADSGRDSTELRFKNVSLHRRGKADNGTLYLTRHHLIFSYFPSVPASNSKDGSSHIRAASITQGQAAKGTSNGTRESPTISSSEKPKNAPRPRSKEIYIPYPLVSYCNFRPSHAQSATVRPPGFDNHTESAEEDDDSFPPTFGTSLAGRPSTDSATRSSFASPRRPASPVASGIDFHAVGGSARPPAIRIRCKDFQVLALHFHPTASGKDADESARQAFYSLRGHCCVDKVDDLYAFHFKPPPEEKSASGNPYDARKEFSRMGIGPKAAEGPGAAWRISDINHDFSYSATYPSVLCVPRTVSDNMLKYGGTFRKKARIPALAYLHSNGGSITRCSQPMVGVQGKRNPQDERLVSAIFSSHTPPLNSPEDSPSQLPTRAADEDGSSGSAEDSLASDASRLSLSKSETALDEALEEQVAMPRKRIYGSTRQNVIADARPKLNVLANRAAGGGIENPANYAGHNDMPIEVSFLNIANIHVMRNSLDKVIESLGNSDYLDLPPNQDLLRKSGWLSHISGLIDGSEMVARVVGLGGSHVLVHCSDGWDRTSQVSALAQIMLDPYYRTLNGFITLVRKDFLSFGHKFRDRNGIEGCEKWFEIENERIQPTRTKDEHGAESNNLQALSSKALFGAKNWFEKNRGNLFKQQNASRDSLSDNPASRSTSPPPNPVLHSTPIKSNDKKHKMDPNEVSPIFHQFLDAVYQFLWQSPNAFEFNERFLRRLYYQVYAGQYGEFLFNNERERSEHEDKLPSAWGYFLARRAEFTNADFASKTADSLLFPRRQGAEREVEVRWWNMLFGRKDEEMNVPRALAQPERSALDDRSASVGAAEVLPVNTKAELASTRAASVAPVSSVPNPSSTLGTPAMTEGEQARPIDASQEETSKRPPMPSQETDVDVLARYAGLPPASSIPAAQPEMEHPNNEQETAQQTHQSTGDPLGVSQEEPQQRQQQQRTGGIDYSAFAQQNAFRE